MPAWAMTMTSTAGWSAPQGSSRPSPAGASRTALARGTNRWVIEQTIALLHWFRRLRIRWEIRDDIHQAFMTLAAAMICWRRLAR